MATPHAVENEAPAADEGISPKGEARDEKADGVGHEVPHGQSRPGENEGQCDRNGNGNSGAGSDVLRNGGDVKQFLPEVVARDIAKL